MRTFPSPAVTFQIAVAVTALLLVTGCGTYTHRMSAGQKEVYGGLYPGMRTSKVLLDASVANPGAGLLRGGVRESLLLVSMPLDAVVDTFMMWPDSKKPKLPPPPKNQDQPRTRGAPLQYQKSQW